MSQMLTIYDYIPWEDSTAREEQGPQWCMDHTPLLLRHSMTCSPMACLTALKKGFAQNIGLYNWVFP
jgi:hypothetical protein